MGFTGRGGLVRAHWERVCFPGPEWTQGPKKRVASGELATRRWQEVAGTVRAVAPMNDQADDRSGLVQFRRTGFDDKRIARECFAARFQHVIDDHVVGLPTVRCDVAADVAAFGIVPFHASVFC